MADVPNLKHVKDLCEGLLGRDVDVKEGDPVNYGDDPAMLGVYKEKDGSVGAIACLDMPLTVYLGAALGLLPPGGAEDMAAENDPNPAVLENTAEFLNVLAHPFFDSLNVHQRLDVVYTPSETAPGNIGDLAAGTYRRDVHVDIKGYGGGNLSMIRVEH